MQVFLTAKKNKINKSNIVHYIPNPIQTICNVVIGANKNMAKKKLKTILEFRVKIKPILRSSNLKLEVPKL
jgi:hypothetical protein